MKKGLLRAVTTSVFLLFFGLAISVQADPLDLSMFAADDGVSEAGGVVTATEVVYADAYFYNDNFLVSDDMLSLSFDYKLTLAPDNEDYLVAVINYTTYDLGVGNLNKSSTDVLVLSGSHSIDLTPFQNTTISLAFGIEANDWGIDSVATFSNFDLTRTGGPAPVPEPATVLLVGTGLAGMAGIKRMNRAKKSA